MSTKVFETILLSLNYVFMIFTMKQTARGLLPEDVAANLGEEAMDPWVLPHLYLDFPKLTWKT